MKGIIVFEEHIAAQREWYINKYMTSFEKRGVSLSLVIDYKAEEAAKSGEYDFAVMRKIDPLLSRRLEALGLRVFNDSKLSEIANDKGKTYDFIKNNTSVPYISYRTIKELSDIFSKAENELKPLFPLVIKSRGGHGGTEVFLIENKKEFFQGVWIEKPDLFIAQRLCSNPGIDVRVYVIGGQIVTAMRRENASLGNCEIPLKDRFKSNFCLGGSAQVFEPDETIINYVNQIAESLRLDFAGIDFIVDNDNFIFNEIEDVVGARMVYNKTDIDIVDLYTGYITESLR